MIPLVMLMFKKKLPKGITAHGWLYLFNYGSLLSGVPTSLIVTSGGQGVPPKVMYIHTYSYMYCTCTKPYIGSGKDSSKGFWLWLKKRIPKSSEYACTYVCMIVDP